MKKKEKVDLNPPTKGLFHINFCNKNDVTLLRTVGVMFADTEKRISDYVN